MLEKAAKTSLTLLDPSHNSTSFNPRQHAQLFFYNMTTKEITLNAGSRSNGSRACYNIGLLMDYHATLMIL